MHSVFAGLAVGAIVFSLATYKRRTGWHWFALSLFAFATIWLTSFVVLYAANVHMSLVAADRTLAEFAGAITAPVILILLAALPPRPRPHGLPQFGAGAERRGPSA